MLTAMRRLESALLLAAAIAGASCVSKPTMTLHHAEVRGVQLGFPPQLGVVMTAFLAVHNPNSYDVAVRAVRGQTIIAGRHVVPVDFRPPDPGVWLEADRTTLVAVPVVVPAPVGLAVLAESASAASVPYRFRGRADVTATRTFQIEADDYSVDESGTIPREQIAAALAVPWPPRSFGFP
jgi:hypothetical protein